MNCCELIGNGRTVVSTPVGFDVDELFTTTDATPTPVRLAQLIGNASGNAVQAAVSILAISNPVSAPGQFSYNLWAYAGRLGAASGAIQYGDITAGVGAFGVPVASTTAGHLLIVTVIGIAATVINWRVTARVIPLNGATP